MLIKPLPLFLCTYVLGIWLSTYWQAPVQWLISLFFMGIGITVYEVFYRRGKNLYLYIASIFFALGMVMAMSQTIEQKGNVEVLANKYVSIIGTVSEEPDLRTDRVNYTVTLEKLLECNREAPLHGQILLSIKEKQSVYSYGSCLKINGIPERPSENGNPGEFSYAKYLSEKGIQLVLYKADHQGICQLGYGHMNFLTDICLKVKQKLVAITKRCLSPKHSGIMIALLFGDTGGLDYETKQNFALTGVVHILSVSGYHVSLLIAICIFFSAHIGLGKKGTFYLTLLITFLYSLMAGGSPPVLRATIMGWVILLSKQLDRPYDWLSSLSLSALVILLLDPFALFNPGFQLSFLATWGIFYLLPFLQQQIKGNFLMKDMLFVTLAAQIAVFPLTSYYFSYFSLVSLIANLIVVPLITLAMLYGSLGTLVGLFSIPFSMVVNACTGIILDLVLWLVKIFAGLPYATVPVKQPPILLIAIYYLLLVFIAQCGHNDFLQVFILREWRSHKRTIVVSMMILVLLLVLKYGNFFARDLKIIFLNVGQGDCAFVLSPNGKTMMIDTGGIVGQEDPEKDAGKLTVLPFLRRQGVEKIDLLILTHPHSDHVFGLEALLDNNIQFDKVIVRDDFQKEPLGRRILQRLMEKHIQILALSGGENVIFDENIKLQLFNDFPLDEGLNNRSIVGKLTFKKFDVLFTGDAEIPVLQMLLKANKDISAEVIKVPHHGSKNAWYGPLYNKVQPSIAVISVGRNYFGHPSPPTLEGLLKLKINTMRTDQMGAIEITTDGQEFTCNRGKELN